MVSARCDHHRCPRLRTPPSRPSSPSYHQPSSSFPPSLIVPIPHSILSHLASSIPASRPFLAPVVVVVVSVGGPSQDRIIIGLGRSGRGRVESHPGLHFHSHTPHPSLDQARPAGPRNAWRLRWILCIMEVSEQPLGLWEGTASESNMASRS